MRYCSSIRVTVASSEDTRSYYRYIAIPMGSLGDTLVLKWYQWSQTEILVYQTGGTSVVVHYCYLFFCPYLYFDSPIM